MSRSPWRPSIRAPTICGCSGKTRRADRLRRWSGWKPGRKVRRSRFLLAANAGIYSRAWRPLGLHIERGKTLVQLNRAKGSGGNFSMRPNGVFAVTSDGKAIVRETEAFAKSRLRVRLASQSGPLLLADGEFHPAFRKDSVNAKIRNAVGATGDGKSGLRAGPSARDVLDARDSVQNGFKLPRRPLPRWLDQRNGLPFGSLPGAGRGQFRRDVRGVEVTRFSRYGSHAP